MNRIVYSFLLILFLGMSNISVCAEGRQPSVGDGTPAHPYQIGTADELVWFRDLVNEDRANAGACAKLIADIDLSSVCSSTTVSWTPIACHSVYFPSSYYWTGTFDGNGHKISNLYIHTTTDEYIGLFGMVNGLIKDLILVGDIDKNSTNNKYGAGLLFGAGDNNTIISNCIVHGSVISGTKAGGICNTCTGSFTNCTNKANVTTRSGGNVGGISASDGTMIGCANYGTITSQSGNANIGGLTGIISSGSINNSCNIGLIIAKGNNASNVGSLIGSLTNPKSPTNSNNFSISNSYNYGNIVSEYGSSKLGYIIGSVNNIEKLSLTNVIINNNAKYQTNNRDVNLAIGSDNAISPRFNPTSLPPTAFTSGKVCYLLNGNKSTDVNWYQTIGTDNCPTPFGNTNSTVYKVEVNSGETFVNENGTIAQIAFIDGEDFITPVPFTITDAQYSRAMTNNWGTLCLPYALNTSECSGVEFYEISSVSNESITLTQITGAIDAGKPVFYLKPTGAASVNFNATNAVIQPTAGTTTESISHWNTIGTYTNQSITDTDNQYYFIASDKIYPKEPSRALTVKPFRAYLSAPSSAGARQFSIEVMGETTAIDALNSLNDDNVQIYDINGIRKPSLSKGINIINGKKIIIR